jgi:hypothetical protein
LAVCFCFQHLHFLGHHGFSPRKLARVELSSGFPQGCDRQIFGTNQPVLLFYTVSFPGGDRA